MKNNVITILVDSVFSDCLSNYRTKESTTPFLDSIIPDSLFTRNIFSYGPYTDAATKGLFCGNKTLDDYGYYFSINSSEYSHYRIFKESGYETIGLYYPYYLISSKVEQYIDHSIYTSGFLYESIWNGKFQYYADKKRKNGLSAIEYSILKKFVTMLFDCWLIFYQNMKKGKSGYIIDKIKDNSIDGLGLLLEEKNKYEKNKHEYIQTILDLGMKHPLAHINDYDYNKLVLQDNVSFAFNNNKNFINKLQKIEFARNLKNNHLDGERLANGIIGALVPKKKKDFRYLKNFGMSLFGNKFLKYMSNKDKWQIEASMMSQINSIFDFIDKRGNDEKTPFYISMHTEEPHNRLTYFTYDIADYDLIEEEFKYLTPLLDNIGEDFAGHIIYQLSLRYVDLCLKRLFEGLEKRNLLSTTTIMVMADHGSSYTFNPLRNTVVNNFYIENYKTPLLIWNQERGCLWKKEYKGYYQGADVFTTLCDVLGIDTEGKFSGQSIIKNENGRDYVITEYMGPGCPDMLSREVWMSINNKKYLVAVKATIDKKLTYDNIVEIYDLFSDPSQSINLVDECRDNKEILGLLELLNVRFLKIGKSTVEYIERIDDVQLTSVI